LVNRSLDGEEKEVNVGPMARHYCPPKCARGRRGEDQYGQGKYTLSWVGGGKGQRGVTGRRITQCNERRELQGGFGDEKGDISLLSNSNTPRCFRKSRLNSVNLSEKKQIVSKLLGRKF